VVEVVVALDCGHVSIVEVSLGQGSTKKHFKFPDDAPYYDCVIQMCHIKRSTRSSRRNAAIIGVDRIICPCHLIGKCGRELPLE
jgi:hypothetical protein